MKIEDLPGISGEDIEKILADPRDPDVWTWAIMNGLSLWQSANHEELSAYLEAVIKEIK